MNGFIDRQRAAQLMAGAGLDAMLLMQPESARWASGADPGVAAFWRRAAAAIIVVPADPAAPLSAIVGDLQAKDFQQRSGFANVRAHPIWVETASLDADALTGDWRADLAAQANSLRPATYDPTIALAHAREILGPLARGRIGVEESFLPVADARLIKDALPDATLSDCSLIVQRLRMVKQPREIEWLDTAARAAEAGLRMLASRMRPGMTAGEMTVIWRDAALAEAARLGAPQPVGAWAYISVGQDGFAAGGPAKAGDIVKIDVGCVVNGYSSDGARTFVMGEASRAAKEIHAGLLGAFERARDLLNVGALLSDLHQAATEAMRCAGFPGYSRGHFGHSCGASIWSEEWPFISADEEATLEPNMVMALETPWYVRGVGGFIIEDQFLIRADGAQSTWSFPRELTQIAI